MSVTTWLRRYVDRKAEPHSESATDAAFDLLERAESGEQWAREATLIRLRDALTREIKTARQSGYTTTLVKGERRATVKTMPSQASVDPTTGEQLSWQLTELWDMNEAQLSELLAAQIRERRSADDRVTVTRKVLAVLKAHPDCATARCAWLADGRSLDEVAV